MHLWVEPAGGEQKSADVEQKTVMLIYPYPSESSVIRENLTEPDQVKNFWTTKKWLTFDQQFICSIQFCLYKYSGVVDFNANGHFNPCHPSFPPNTTSLSPQFSLYLSLPLLLPLFPHSFYLSQFHINTQQIWCWLSLIKINWLN